MNFGCQNNITSRRGMLRSLAAGSLLFPGILSQLLTQDASASAIHNDYTNPLGPKSPHFAPRAKNVIFLYMSGGVSHVDTFDPKPELNRLDGKSGPGKARQRYLRSFWNFQRGGKCGTEVSDLFPHVRECMDDICLLRGMHGDAGDHFQATLGLHTGSVSVTRPSIGSWVTYGLGTECANLPGFVVLAPMLPYAGSQVWSSNFLPGTYNGTRVLPGAEPIPDLNRRAVSAELQSSELGLLAQFNRRHQTGSPNNSALAARIKSFETAAGMQMEMPQVLDLSKETDATLDLYGLERGNNKGFGWQCLVARRLVERGVRFVELIDTGSSDNWDSHADMHQHEPLAKNVDKPIAGLLRDLKSRGMLDDTLVVWTTEFGRSPNAESALGRGHYPYAYSSWLAGGGVKGGMVYGKTDEVGAHVVDEDCHVHDFHATILHLLGLNHEKLTFRYAGRDFRLTDVAGKVITPILA